MLLSLLLGLMWNSSASAADVPSTAPARPSTTWFTDAGFGIFLHWGAYTTAAGRWHGKERTYDLWGEWLLNRAGIARPDYEALARQFNPTAFDAAQWAQIFKDAGAKYVVLTAKHHEGFAMYHSAVTKYNVVDWPTDFHRDVVRELGDAVRADDMKFCVYYSQEIDWHNRGKNYDDYFNNFCMPQVTELLSHYGPLGIMWFDIGLHEKAKADQLRALVRKLAPQTLISPRIGGGDGDYSGGGDNEIPPTVKPAPWESCMTLNYHWATYPQDVYQHSATEIIRMLADIRSKGGNLLLDTGPQPDGTLAPRDIAVLRRVGNWLKRFGDSIYGVAASPMAAVPWGCITSGRDNTLYLHVFDVPASGQIILPGITGSIESCWLLGDPQRTPLDHGNDQVDHPIRIPFATAPPEALDSDDMVIAVRLAPGAKFDPDYLIENDFGNVFHPASAKLLGNARYVHQHLNWYDADDPAVEKSRYDELGLLPTSAAALQWRFRSFDPGDFHIVVDYAESNPIGGKLIVQVDDQLFTAELHPTPADASQTISTKSYINVHFTPLRLGTAALRTRGVHAIRISAAEPPGAAPVAINRVVLVPTRTTPLDRSVDALGKPAAPATQPLSPTPWPG
jgi:alpha-L-fucosidase